MSYTYWVHEKIQKDLNEGFAWYEDKIKGLGYEFLNSIENKFLRSLNIHIRLEARVIPVIVKH